MENKYQEALTILKTHIVDYDEELEEESYLYSSYKEEFDTLQELVDKETPKTPVYSGRPADTQQYCPVCHSRVANIKYCWNCGQRLDWSGENE